MRRGSDGARLTSACGSAQRCSHLSTAEGCCSGLETRRCNMRREVVHGNIVQTRQTRSGGAFAAIGTATVAGKLLVPGAVSDRDRLTTTTATIDYSGVSPAPSIGRARCRPHCGAAAAPRVCQRGQRERCNFAWRSPRCSAREQRVGAGCRAALQTSRSASRRRSSKGACGACAIAGVPATPNKPASCLGRHAKDMAKSRISCIDFCNSPGPGPHTLPLGLTAQGPHLPCLCLPTL